MRPCQTVSFRENLKKISRGLMDNDDGALIANEETGAYPPGLSSKFGWGYLFIGVSCFWVSPRLVLQLVNQL